MTKRIVLITALILVAVLRRANSAVAAKPGCPDGYGEVSEWSPTSGFKFGSNYIYIIETNPDNKGDVTNVEYAVQFGSLSHALVNGKLAYTYDPPITLDFNTIHTVNSEKRIRSISWCSVTP